jgi:hypothetical protein
MTTHDTRNFISAAAAAIRIDSHYRKGGPTRDRALTLYGADAVTPADFAAADAAINWVGQQPINSEFDQKLAAAAASTRLTRSELGIAAYLPEAHRRAIENASRPAPKTHRWEMQYKVTAGVWTVPLRFVGYKQPRSAFYAEFETLEGDRFSQYVRRPGTLVAGQVYLVDFTTSEYGIGLYDGRWVVEVSKVSSRPVTLPALPATAVEQLYTLLANRIAFAQAATLTGGVHGVAELVAAGAAEQVRLDKAAAQKARRTHVAVTDDDEDPI